MVAIGVKETVKSGVKELRKSFLFVLTFSRMKGRKMLKFLLRMSQ